MVGEDGRLPLPWLGTTLAQALAMPHAHALLLQAAAGAGALELALTAAQAWLCEADAALPRPCGRCQGCRLAARRSHPDLRILLPEEMRLALGAPADEAEPESGEGGKAKRKPSRQIRIDEVRSAIDWIVTTASRGGAKVVVIHPAERMNVQAANALLKTLEEPPRGARLLLTAADPVHLLPTVRSRCQRLRLAAPAPDVAQRWLEEQGVREAQVLLAACSGLPLEALALAQAGVDAARWAGLPKALLKGQAAELSGWPLPRVVDTLQKLCHDGMALAAGAAPRFFPSVPPARDAAALAALGRRLSDTAASADHPRNEALFVEALLADLRQAWIQGPKRFATLRP